MRQVGLFVLFQSHLRYQFQKTTWKFTFSGLGKVLAAYLKTVLLVLLFQQSLQVQVMATPVYYFSLLVMVYFSINQIHFSADSDQPVSNAKKGTSQIKGTGSKKNAAILIVGIVVGVGSVCFLVFTISILFYRRKGRSSEDEGNQNQLHQSSSFPFNSQVFH